MRRTWIEAGLAMALLAGPLAAAEPLAVTVNLKQVAVERFLGAGVQWDPYEYLPSPEAWKTTLARVDFMRPGFLRVMLNASSYLRGFDANGNPRYVWSEGESGMERLSSLFAILDYAQAHNIRVLIGEWSPARGLNTGSGGRSGPGDPHFARVHADFLNYLHGSRKYSVITHIIFMNEPNGNWMWPGGNVDYAGWAQGIRNLHQELDARGMGWVKIAGPDNSGNWEWLDRCATELPQEFGAWEMHWYAKDAEVTGGAIEKLLAGKRDMLLKTDPQAAAKPRFLGESGIIEGKTNGDQQPRVKEFSYGVLMADYVAQVARAGWAGAVAWDMDDAMHVNTGGHVNPPGAMTLKIWGFWNTQGTAMGHPEDEAVRPWFYTWSMMARLFPAGSRIVSTQDSAQLPGMRTLAGTHGEGASQEISVMVVNDSDVAESARIAIPGAGRRAVELYRYFDRDRPADANGFPVAAQTLPTTDLARCVTVELPSRGVVFLTTVAGR
jgi:hypothetical protein